MHTSSSYAKILGEKLFRTWEIPRSGSKAEDGEERERERKLVKTMAKLRMAHASTHGARKPPGPIVTRVSLLVNKTHRKLGADKCTKVNKRETFNQLKY